MVPSYSECLSDTFQVCQQTQMIIRYASVVLKLCSLGLVLAAGGLWASVALDARPKLRDENTIVGGTLWSQTIIPLGLMISRIVDDSLDFFVDVYYLLSGFVLLTYTGTVLITGEYKAMQTRVESSDSPQSDPRTPSYDKVYLAMGILSMLAAVFTFTDLLVLLIT